MMKERRTFTPEQKVNIVLEVLREERTLNEIAAEHKIHPNVVTRWKSEFLQNAAQVFSKDANEAEALKQAHEAEKEEFLKQIGQLSYENSWLKKKSGRI